jgi:hypothetical protein
MSVKEFKFSILRMGQKISSSFLEGASRKLIQGCPENMKKGVIF